MRMPRPSSGDQRREHVAEVLGLGPVEPRGRLVEEEQARSTGDGTGELDQPPLAGRQVGGALRRRGAAIPHRSMASKAAARTVAVSPGRARRWRQGVRPASRASRPRATLSKTVRESYSSIRWKVRPRPELGPGLGAHAGDVVAEEEDPAVVRPVETGADVEGGRLARPVGSDQSGDAAERRGEADTVRRGEAAETDDQTFDAQAFGGGSAHRQDNWPLFWGCHC